MFELNYKGRRVQLKASGPKTSLREIRSLLESVAKVEAYASESNLRESVVRQLKSEILEGESPEEVLLGFWDIPQDLVKNKDIAQFMMMEADLNPSLHYEKGSFVLNVLVDEKGKQVVFDRKNLHQSLQKLQLQEKLSKAHAILARFKGTVPRPVQVEIEDYIKKSLPVERVKVVYERRSYGERVSYDLVLFGDFVVQE